MSSGAEHLSTWKLLRPLGLAWGGVMGASAYLVTEDPALSVVIGAGSIAGYMLGYFLSPDLDLVGISAEESRMMRSIPVLGVLLVMWWLPYAYIMRFVGIGRKGHRNFFSHTPFIGTFFRVAWLLLFPAFSFPIYQIIKAGYLEYVGYPAFGILLGLSLADTIHWAMDMRASG